MFHTSMTLIMADVLLKHQLLVHAFVVIVVMAVVTKVTMVTEAARITDFVIIVVENGFAKQKKKLHIGVILL